MRKAPGLMLLSFLATGWLWVAAGFFAWDKYYQPGPILQFNNPPFSVLNSPVPAGGALIVKWYGEKLIACPGTGESWVNQGNDPEQSVISIRTNVLKRDIGPFAAAVSYPIPAWLPAGTYDMQTRIQQNCGGLRKPQVQRLPPVRFTVKDQDG